MTIEILTSGVALGVHVPGLLLADRLREKGVPVGVSVLERLLPAQKLATTAVMKFAFHRDFRVTLAGYDCSIDVCHVDSFSSPSFTKTVTDLDVRHVWLADADTGTIPYGSVFGHLGGRDGAWREAAAVRLWRDVADQVRRG